MANNVNQLAKWANANHALPAPIEMHALATSVGPDGSGDSEASRGAAGRYFEGRADDRQDHQGGIGPGASSATSSDRARRTSTPTSGSSPPGLALGGEEAADPQSSREIADLGAALDAANDSYGTNPAGGHIWHVLACRSQPAIAT